MVQKVSSCGAGSVYLWYRKCLAVVQEVSSCGEGSVQLWCRKCLAVVQEVSSCGAGSVQLQCMKCLALVQEVSSCGAGIVWLWCSNCLAVVQEVCVQLWCMNVEHVNPVEGIFSITLGIQTIYLKHTDIMIFQRTCLPVLNQRELKRMLSYLVPVSIQQCWLAHSILCLVW